MSNDAPDIERYRRQAVLADSYWEFHRDAFDILDEDELRSFLNYYPQDLDEIPDQYAYRTRLLSDHPEAEPAGHSALLKVLRALGLDEGDLP